MVACPPFFTNEKIMRVYVALPLPETFKTELRQRLRPLRKENHEYHWVDDADDLHITIANPVLFESNMNEVHAVPGELDAQGALYVQKAVKKCAAGFGPIKISSPGLFFVSFIGIGQVSLLFHPNRVIYTDAVRRMVPGGEW
jgi:2'-5' RNA ligase